MSATGEQVARLSEALRVHLRSAATLEERLKSDGLSVRELSICAPLLTGAASNTSELSDWAGQPYSSIAAAISRLTKSGLIEAGRQPDDRRVGTLRLTQSGRRATKRGLATMADWLESSRACASRPADCPPGRPAP